MAFFLAASILIALINIENDDTAASEEIECCNVECAMTMVYVVHMVHVCLCVDGTFSHRCLVLFFFSRHFSFAAP